MGSPSHTDNANVNQGSNIKPGRTSTVIPVALAGTPPDGPLKAATRSTTMPPPQTSQSTPIASGRLSPTTRVTNASVQDTKSKVALDAMETDQDHKEKPQDLQMPQDFAGTSNTHTSKPSRPVDDTDVKLDLARKKKKVMQRDLHRLAVKFEELKEKYFYNKDRLLEEEKRLVHAGTHKELLDQLDEIQKSHDSRLAVAQRRLDMTQQAAINDCDACIESAQAQMIAQRAAMRWGMMKETYEMLLRCESDYTHELDKKVDLDVEVKQFEEACGGVQDPTLRYDRFGIFPDRLTSLATFERDEDLKTLRQAVPALR